MNAFRSNGARTIGVPLRADGIDLAILEETLRTEKKAKLLYLIPTFQNPSGITSTAENRHAVYALAKKYGVVILEDNPYGELRFAGADVPTYKSFDTDGIVIYCSSFSKILSSGMRIGFVNAPAEIIAKMVVAKQVEDVHTNLFAQMLCHRYMAEYDMDAHVAMIRELYRNKANRMLTALDAEMPQSVAYTRPEGGLFLWCTLPDGRDAAPFVRKFLENKVAVVPGSAFMCVENAPSDSFRLNYSMPSDEDIDRGVAILGKVLRDIL